VTRQCVRDAVTEWANKRRFKVRVDGIDGDSVYVHAETQGTHVSIIGRWPKRSIDVILDRSEMRCRSDVHRKLNEYWRIDVALGKELRAMYP
jgi:hypothetical protein